MSKNHQKQTQEVKPDQKSAEMSRRAKAQRDTRDPGIIFAERVNTELRLMDARFRKLIALGNAKRAKPTQEQHEAAAAWLREQTENAIEALGRKLTQPDASAPKPEPQSFMVVPGAPAKAAPSKPAPKQ